MKPESAKLIKRGLPLYVMILPGLLYFLIFRYAPMGGLIIIFKEYDPIRGFARSAWVGLEQFKRLFSEQDLSKLLGNTIILSLLNLFLFFPAPIILALLLNEIRQRHFKKVVQMVTYAPYFISTVVVCGMIILFLNREMGVLNHIRAFFGQERLNFITQPELFRTIYVLSGVWQNTGWSTIIYLAVLSGVSPELVEAARMDGANRFQVIRHVNIPHIVPTIIILFILRCGSIFNLGFEKIFLLQNPLNLSTSEVISTYVYRIGLLGAQFSYSTAIGLFNTVCNLILLLIVNRISAKVSETSLW